MIAAWLLYCTLIALAFAVVGYALERGLHLAGRSTRWAWVVALAGSCLVPLAAWLRPEAFGSLPVPLVAPIVTEVTGDLTQVAAPWSLSSLDGVLRWAWGLSSAGLLLTLVAAGLRLRALRRRWSISTVDGRVLLVSENVGPAVAGLWHPRVVVPNWALQLGERERHLMLAHEEEHVRAGDPWLLALGAAALVVAPWNAGVWWQVLRLRLAVEMDCDARVLAQEGAAPEYGELLLQVGRRRARLPLCAPALGEPASFLEQRIRRMATALPRWRWAGAALALIVAAAAMAGACEAPRPVEPERQVPLHPPGLVLDEVFLEWVVEERPQVLAAPQPLYPELLRHAGIHGRVVLEGIIDTLGRVEPRSIKIISTPHPGFDQSAISVMQRALFRPARVQGQAVRVLIRIPIQYSLPSDRAEMRD